MPKIEVNARNPSDSFNIDGVPYQRGGYEMIIDGDLIGINRMNARKIDSAVLVDPVHFSEWTNGILVPYSSVDAFIAEVETWIFTE